MRAAVFARSVMRRPCFGAMAVAMVVSISLFDGRVPRDLEWTDQARGPAAPRSPSRNGSVGFFPLPQRAAFLARQKSRLPPSSAALRA
jgi:hypothetical protein